MTAIIQYRPSAQSKRVNWVADAEQLMQVFNNLKSSVDAVCAIHEHQGMILETLRSVSEDFAAILMLRHQGQDTSERVEDVIERMRDIVDVTAKIVKEVGLSKERTEEAATQLHRFIATKLPQ